MNVIDGLPQATNLENSSNYTDLGYVFNNSDEEIIYHFRKTIKNKDYSFFITNYLNIESYLFFTIDGITYKKKVNGDCIYYFPPNQKIRDLIAVKLHDFLDSRVNIPGITDGKWNVIYRNIKTIIIEFLALNYISLDNDMRGMDSKLSSLEKLVEKLKQSQNELIIENNNLKKENLELLVENHNLIDIIKQNEKDSYKLEKELTEKKSRLLMEETKSKILSMEINGLRDDINSSASDSFREFNRLFIENNKLAKEIGELKRVTIC